jgi:hypothetical protein
MAFPWSWIVGEGDGSSPQLSSKTCLARTDTKRTTAIVADLALTLMADPFPKLAFNRLAL